MIRVQQQRSGSGQRRSHLNSATDRNAASYNALTSGRIQQVDRVQRHASVVLRDVPAEGAVRYGAVRWQCRGGFTVAQPAAQWAAAVGPAWTRGSLDGMSGSALGCALGRGKTPGSGAAHTCRTPEVAPRGPWGPTPP